MRLTFKFHTSMEGSLRSWRQSLGTTEEQRSELCSLFLQACRTRLSDHQGRPPDVILDPRTDPMTYWVELGGGVWIQYLIRTRKSAGLFSPAEEQILFIALGAKPSD